MQPPTGANGVLQVLGAWTEGTDTICIVYRGWWHPSTLGLRRQIESDWPVDAVVEYIVTSELGEPLGSREAWLEPDEHGIHWWVGDPPDWRVQY